MRKIFDEGRCLSCGMRVTVDRGSRRHQRDGQWCEPVETDQPFTVPDKPPSSSWLIPSRTDPGRARE